MRSSLQGTNLPFYFRYSHPELDSGMSITRTCGGVVFQESSSASILEGKLLPWKIENGTPEDYKFFYDFHQSRQDREFIGYWGEVYTVRSFSLDSPNIGSRIYSFGGGWVIRCVGTEINPVCDLDAQLQGTPSG